MINKDVRVERDLEMLPWDKDDTWDSFNAKRHARATETEKDPNGLDAKQPGSKLDARKVSVVRGCLHYFPRAITAVAELSQIGARKYSWKGWETVPDGIHRYGDAMGRHELQIEDDYSRLDPDTGVLEATAVCWNALARLELILRGPTGSRDEVTKS